jgi:hypothetical protein
VLAAIETYHWYAGSPLHLLLLHEGGHATEPTLGPDLERGERPQLVVPAGTWQGSAPTSGWSLVGTTMAPPFGWSGFRLGERADLVRRWPTAHDRITGSRWTGGRTSHPGGRLHTPPDPCEVAPRGAQLAAGVRSGPQGCGVDRRGARMAAGVRSPGAQSPLSRGLTVAGGRWLRPAQLRRPSRLLAEV